jgi:hypothetical protein
MAGVWLRSIRHINSRASRLKEQTGQVSGFMDDRIDQKSFHRKQEVIAVTGGLISGRSLSGVVRIELGR